MFCRSPWCCCPIAVLGITSMDVQCTATLIQTWRKWTTIWRESVYVNKPFFSYLVYIMNITTYYSDLLSSCCKESLCGQRGLVPNSDIQTFQVSITNRLRMQYDRIQDSLSRVCAHLCRVCVFCFKLNIKKKRHSNFCFNGSCSSEERTFTADGCIHSQLIRAAGQSLQHHEPLPGVCYWPCKYKETHHFIGPTACLFV